MSTNAVSYGWDRRRLSALRLCPLVRRGERPCPVPTLGRFSGSASADGGSLRPVAVFGWGRGRRGETAIRSTFCGFYSRKSDHAALRHLRTDENPQFAGIEAYFQVRSNA